MGKSKEAMQLIEPYRLTLIEAWKTARERTGLEDLSLVFNMRKQPGEVTIRAFPRHSLLDAPAMKSVSENILGLLREPAFPASGFARAFWVFFIGEEGYGCISINVSDLPN